MGDWRSIVDTAIWTKPPESLWVLNGFALMRRPENAVLRERLKDKELLDWADLGGMNSTAVEAKRFCECW